MKKQKSNWVLTIVLILGTLTVFFPLYMAVIIAFKKPSEMTNDVAGALSFPSKWSFSNFTEAMKVTDFWHSLGNSLLITIVTIVLAILIHSIAGYVIGRGMARKKSFRFIYLYIVSGMFVPFSILMMPLVKQTAQMGLGNRAGVIILYLVFYMPMNVLLYSGYLKNIPMALEEAADIDGASTWTTYWRVVFPMMKPMHATVAILTACHHVRNRTEYTATGTAEFPDTVWNQLQSGICIIYSGFDPDTYILYNLPEADIKRCCKRCNQGIIFKHYFNNDME